MREKFALLFFLLGTLFLFSFPNSDVQKPLSDSKSTEAVVTKVVDGDSFFVRIGTQTEEVRALGIDAPEYNECFGSEASEEAMKLLRLKSVKLENDPSQSDRDIYNRLLRYVFVDNLNFAQKMIEEGFAKENTFKGVPYKYQYLFKNAQKEAK